jgi:hypothetical protein
MGDDLLLKPRKVYCAQESVVTGGVQRIKYFYLVEYLVYKVGSNSKPNTSHRAVCKLWYKSISGDPCHTYLNEYAYRRFHSSGLELKPILLPRFCIRNNSMCPAGSDGGGGHRSRSVRDRRQRRWVLRAVRWRKRRVTSLILLIRVRIVASWSWLAVLLLITLRIEILS